MNKDKGLYYLFPGQGQGKRKRFFIHLAIGFGVGLIAAGIITGLCYLFDTMGP